MSYEGSTVKSQLRAVGFRLGSWGLDAAKGRALHGAPKAPLD
jgi:hypothetical protein